MAIEKYEQLDPEMKFMDMGYCFDKRAPDFVRQLSNAQLAKLIDETERFTPISKRKDLPYYFSAVEVLGGSESNAVYAASPLKSATKEEAVKRFSIKHLPSS